MAAEVFPRKFRSRGFRALVRRRGMVGDAECKRERRRKRSRQGKLREIRGPIKESGINGGRISLDNCSVEYSVESQLVSVPLFSFGPFYPDTFVSIAVSLELSRGGSN